MQESKNQMYKDKGSYNIGYFLIQALLSFLIAHILVIVIKYVFLFERIILEIKNQWTKDKGTDLVENVKRCIILKNIIFYVCGIIILILFWCLLSSFCVIYQNSKIFLLINTFISSLFSLIYSFFINLLSGTYK